MDIWSVCIWYNAIRSGKETVLEVRVAVRGEKDFIYNSSQHRLTQALCTWDSIGSRGANENIILLYSSSTKQ